MNNLEKSKNNDVYEMIRSIAEDENLKRFLEEYKNRKNFGNQFQKVFQQR
jgi:hypothetical protein